MASHHHSDVGHNTAGGSSPRTPRWLLVVPVLPADAALKSTALERLRHLGAIVVRPSVFVLPESPVAREEIGWLKAEVERGGGEVTAFAADSVDTWTDDALIAEFRRGSEAAYEVLARDLERALELTSSRKPRATGRAKLLERFDRRSVEIERLDFFGTPARERVRSLLAALKSRLADTKAARRGTEVPAGESCRRRLWVTRPRPGADRMASAWLIRRFIDTEATFGFAPNAGGVTDEAVPFDMFGVALSRRGDECTFEALRDHFAVRDEEVERLARLVHELDRHDGRYDVSGADTLARIIDGLQRTEPDDGTLLRYGMVLFEALYQSPSLLGPA